MQPLLVVMGVSGSGKSTVGALLATELDVPFVDADSLHCEANVQKMAAGHPLTDEDRWPWLHRVGEALRDAEGGGLVIACSALKRSYRDALREVEPRAQFILLDGPRKLLVARLTARYGHFMPESLLDSQRQTLERLEPDEHGLTESIDQTPTRIVAEIQELLVGRSP